MFQKTILLAFLCINTSLLSQTKYVKNFYNNGQVQEEGWLKNNKKNSFWKYFYRNGDLKKEGHFKNNLETKYWYFYRPNKLLEREGHFIKGAKTNWWLYYDKAGNLAHKCQLKNNQKNGYCLLYKMKQIVKASKYKNGKKIKEWTDFSSFKDENNLNDLRQ